MSEVKNSNISCKIYKLIANKDIIKPDYIGGDSYEYCLKHNLFHVDTPKGSVIYCRAVDYDWSDGECHSFCARSMETIVKFMKEYNCDMYVALSILRGKCGGGYMSNEFTIVDKDFKTNKK